MLDCDKLFELEKYMTSNNRHSVSLQLSFEDFVARSSYLRQG